MPDPALLSLEEPSVPVGAPQPEPAAPVVVAPVVAEPVVAAPAEPVAEPEPTDPQAAGLLRDLRAERAANKALKEAADLGQNLANALRANPKAYAMLVGGDAPPEPAKTDDPPDQELFELARDLALTTPQGQYDLEAARRVYALNLKTAERVARRVSDEAIAPIRQQQVTATAQERSLKVLETAKTLGLDEKIAKLVVDTIYQSMPEAFGTVEGGAEVVVRIAGLQYLKDKGLMPNGAQPAPAAPQQAAPVFTERPSGPGGGNAPVALSAIEKRAANRAGISEAEWQKTVGALNTGAVPKRYQELE